MVGFAGAFVRNDRRMTRLESTFALNATGIGKAPRRRTALEDVGLHRVAGVIHQRRAGS